MNKSENFRDYSKILYNPYSHFEKNSNTYNG